MARVPQDTKKWQAVKLTFFAPQKGTPDSSDDRDDWMGAKIKTQKNP